MNKFKNVTIFVVIFFVCLLFSANKVQASAATLYPDFIADDEIAQCVVSSESTNGFSSIDEELTQSTFEDKALSYETLDCYYTQDVESLSGIEYFKNTTRFAVDNLNESITTIPNEILQLTNLESLAIRNSEINTLSGVENLTELKFLQVQSAKVSEIKYVDNLTNLQNLWLSGNDITKIENIESLTNMYSLDLSNNHIEEIQGLETLVNMEKLYLYNNEIEEIKGLDSLVNLTTLHLNDNFISKIEGLDNLSELEIITLNYNNITKIEGLDNQINLISLLLGNNKISKIEGLDNLENLGRLSLYYNNITKIEGLDNLTKLYELSLFNNKIKDISGLENTSIRNINLFDNYIVDLNSISNEAKEANGIDSISEQTTVVYLPLDSSYDEIFKSTNCPSDSCEFNESDFLIDGQEYTSVIDNSQLDDVVKYTLSLSSENSGSVIYDSINSSYTLDVTIIGYEPLVAEDSEDMVESAASSEDELKERLSLEGGTYLGYDLTNYVEVYDLDGYDYDDPQVGVYDITFKLDYADLETQYVTVSYDVYKMTTLTTSDAVKSLDEAPTSMKDLLMDLETIIENRDGMMDGEEVLKAGCEAISIDGYDMDNPQVGEYEIMVMYSDDTGDHTSTSMLTIMEEDTTEPEVTEPEVTEPEVTEPEVTEPEVTEPEVTDSSENNEISNTGISYSTYLIGFTLMIITSLLTVKKIR